MYKKIKIFLISIVIVYLLFIILVFKLGFFSDGYPYEFSPIKIEWGGRAESDITHHRVRRKEKALYVDRLKYFTLDGKPILFEPKYPKVGDSLEIYEKERREPTDYFVVEGHRRKGFKDSLNRFICSCYNSKDIQSDNLDTLFIRFYKKGRELFGFLEKPDDLMCLHYRFFRDMKSNSVILKRYSCDSIVKVDCDAVIRKFGLYSGDVFTNKYFGWLPFPD